jgi:predicted phosphodiesterase
LVLILALVLFSAPSRMTAQAPPLARFGVVTDLHSADIDPAGVKTYRDSAAKLAACVKVMNGERVQFLLELGDFKDQDTPPVEARTRGFLRTIESVMAGFEGPRYHVIGNHDTDSLSKAQFLEATSNTGIAPAATRYTFMAGGVRFVVLDADHRRDGSDYDHGNFEWSDSNIDALQVEWLAKTLADSVEPAIVLVHQQLNGMGSYCVKNAPDVRQTIEASGKVIAVLQGHRHEGAYSEINGVPYFTFKGAVEGAGTANNAFSIVEVLPDLGLRVTGYGRAESRGFRAAAADALLQKR